MQRDEAVALDRIDPLAAFRGAFAIDDPALIYLDGNSLGRLPLRTVEVMRHVVEDEWGAALIRGWHRWIDLPTETGDLLAPLIGAEPGTVVIADQTSINLYKLATAALRGAAKSDIVTSRGNFPSDLYVLDAVAAAAGGSVRVIDVDDAPTAADVAGAVDVDVGLVSLSHVEYRSGTIVDMAGVTAAAHRVGALALWDLSHSAGAIPVELKTTGADMAVGCTYKHLNGGPGAPAFLYVRRGLHAELSQPIPGWFGHADMFGFAPDYVPAPDIRQFMVGTPPILSLVAARSGIEVTAEAGILAIYEKVKALTAVIIDAFDRDLADLGFRLTSPRDATLRGAHVGLAHDEGYQVTQAMIERGVIPDFRAPDVVRLGVAGLYTTFTEVWDAMAAMADVVRSGSHLTYPEDRSGVT